MKLRGVSILEMVLCMVVITVAALAVFELFPGALWASKKGEAQRQAALLAHSALEEARARPFSSFNVSAPAETLAPALYGGITYARSLQAFPVTLSGHPSAHVVELRATVRYRLRDRDQTVTHSLYVTKVRR